MATIITRAGKGSPLLNTEVDANFVNLNDDKIEESIFNAGTFIYATSDNTPQPKTVGEVSDILLAQDNYLNSNKIYARGTTASPNTSEWIGYDAGMGGWKIQSAGGVEIAEHLYVNGSRSRTMNYAFLASSGITGTTTNGTNNYSIYASARIATSSINVYSDKRIKDIIGISDAALDAKVLMGIEITDYSYKETGEAAKKVIAQQLEKVMPQAVSLIQKYIPDILRLAESVDNVADTAVISLAAHGLSAGDFVELESSSSASKIQAEVIESTVNTFTVKGNYPDAFVVGRRVDDFRVVDYEAISMLAVSALQHEITQRNLLESRIAAIEELLSLGTTK